MDKCIEGNSDERSHKVNYGVDTQVSSSLPYTEVDVAEGNPGDLKQWQHPAVESVYVNGDGNTPCFTNPIPRLNIAILVVGTRGDVQPFVAVAKKLQEFGHRVRLATHVTFSNLVKEAGVEFYPLGGDPRLFSRFMAKSKGLGLSREELALQRKHFHAIMGAVLPACTEPDIKTGAPFRAQAIMANPPAFGQTDVAEALGVPIHILFTVPWTPTCEFPSPIANLPQTPGNWWSYILVDLVIWWITRGHINMLREGKLKLPPIPYFSTYFGSKYHLPTTYMWSRYVLPKPKDWGPLVDIAGYCFLDLGSSYQPPEELVDWMKRGSRPIYVGFGSMILGDPRRTTSIILEALKCTGQRGILDSGWSDLGLSSEVSGDVFLLEDCPHDWLFPQCAAVIHHGGGGTTAAGLRAGCPTTVVPVWGDQYFWGDRIHEKGLGPRPIPIAQLSVEELSKAITFMMQPEVKLRAMEIAELIAVENGVQAAVDAFHQNLSREPPLRPAFLKEDSHPNSPKPNPNPIQWLFIQIGTLCCHVCS
ncbi:sterol 3-beta-glucosyltransferase UGT80B1-like isoform X2 [Silene latifolia]|uniref:sterol 3-beta-glucosyltransferase UGT80B1-like isoform X2 n=1 Tax=Silene latifolia TaxID=37657 RepID=UPI003D786CBB